MAPRWSLESSLEAIELSLDDTGDVDVDVDADVDDRDDDFDVDSDQNTQPLHDEAEEEDDYVNEVSLNLDLDLHLDLQSDHSRSDGVVNRRNDSQPLPLDDDDIDSLLPTSPTISEADEIDDDDEHENVDIIDDEIVDNERSDNSVSDIGDGDVTGIVALDAKDEERQQQQQQHFELETDEGSLSQSLTLSSSSSSSDDGSVSDFLPGLENIRARESSVSSVPSSQPSSCTDKKSLKSIMKPLSPSKCAKRSANHRSVSFCPMATILLHPHITEYTPSEIGDSWYSSVDLKQFRQDCLDVADRLEGSSTILSPSSKMDDEDGNRHTDSEEFCARGCEYKTRVGTMLRQKHRRDAMRAVFDYQDSQRAKQRHYSLHHHRHYCHQNFPKTGHDRGVVSLIDQEELARIYSTWTHHSQQVARIMGNIDRSAVTVIKIDRPNSSNRTSEQNILDSSSPRKALVGDKRQSSTAGKPSLSIHEDGKSRQHRLYENNSDERREGQEDHHERHGNSTHWRVLGLSSLFHHSNSSNSNERRHRNGYGNPSSPLMPTSPPAFSSMATAFASTNSTDG